MIGKNLGFIDAFLGQSMVPWMLALPSVAGAVALLVFPGLLLAWALGLRGVWAVSLSPVLTASLVAASALLCWWLRFDWNISVFCLTVLSFTTVVFGTLRLSMRWRRGTTTVPYSKGLGGPAHWAALLVASLLVSLRYIQIVEHPSNLNQGMDSPFHYNLVQYIVDSGDGSPFASGALVGEGSGFYPQVWHALAALLAESTWLPAVEASNALNLAIVAVAWPLGVLLLVRTVCGLNAVALMGAAVACGGFFAFPFTLMQSEVTNFGPLFPYMLAVSFLPPLIAVLASLLKFGRALPLPRPVAAGTLAFGLLGLTSTHMSALVAFAALTSTVAIMAAIRSFRRLRQHDVEHFGYLKWLVLWLSVFVAGFLVWLYVRPRSGTWEPIDTLAAAAVSVVLAAPTHGEVGWGVAVLTILGTVLLVRRPTERWFLSAYAVACALYLVAAAIPDAVLRVLAIGAWYGDPPRLAALLPMFWAVFAGVAVGWLFERFRSYGISWGLPVGLAVLAASLLAFPTSSGTSPGRERNYALSDSSSLLNSEESELLERIEDHVPEGAVIANNPWDGSSATYALTGRKVLFPHIFVGSSEERLLVAEQLNQAVPGSDVCQAVEKENVRFLLDFGGSYIGFPTEETNSFPGLEVPENSSSFVIVDQQGPATLYKFVGCDA